MFFIPEIALYALDVYYNQTYLQTSSKKKFPNLDNIYWQKCNKYNCCLTLLILEKEITEGDGKKS